MTASLYLSRVRLRAGRGEALASIAPILLPDDISQRTGRAHRLVWLLFQDAPAAARDFLWRDEGDGRYLILSPRLPTNRSNLFELDTKAFEPHIERGDELRFSLRANPTVARKAALTPEARAARQRGKRVDVVMDALAKIPALQRAIERDSSVARAGRQWLDEQGSRAGFKLKSLETGGYASLDLSDGERRGRRKRATVSTMDFAGIMEIDDPGAFLAKLAQGFGSAKAFGCGLMLIRRA